MLHHSPLGREVYYNQHYSPEILFAIARTQGREARGIKAELPFRGVDIWTSYELCWLDTKGKPCVAVGEFFVPVESPFIIESKSFKLYLNSLNATRFENLAAVRQTLKRDISGVTGSDVTVKLVSPQAFSIQTTELQGLCVDDLDVTITDYDVQPAHLKTCNLDEPPVTEALLSHLLRSNCPVTGQPDWASVLIRYTGPRIDREGLLKYIVSLREHTGFHEQCVEQMFVDIKQRCKPARLTVYARYTRRGGIDINPFRSDFEGNPVNTRNFRQ